MAGTFHNQSLEVEGETRAYFLHVPAQYDCATAWPVLVDFHGTSGGEEPEISYKNDELVALADAEGFIALRPRSRSSIEGGQATFRWDQNPGDLERNVAFTRALLTELGSRYHLDPARTYASGFSSGTNMSLQFLAEDPPLFQGLGLVAGGIWTPPAQIAGDPKRIYATTGYRDYMWTYWMAFTEILEGRQFPDDRLFVRESDTGHELYGWHFQELWAWLDRGERPASGTLATGWTRDDGFGEGVSLTELVRGAGGALVATSADGRVFRRDTAGAWSEVGAITGGSPLEGGCVGADGHGVAVGDTQGLDTDDGGQSWHAGTRPPDPGGFFGGAYLSGVACGPAGRIVGGGYWAAVTSEDGGATWDVGDMTASYGFGAQTVAVAISESGTWLAAGYYDYLGRSTDGVEFSPVTSPDPREWWTGAVARDGRFWVAGEEGRVLLSDDDGASFSLIQTPTSEDLYALDFLDENKGLAVGSHGAAVLTRDGGATWTDVSTGLDGFLGGVVFLEATRAIVVGEGGTVLELAVP